MNFKYKCALQHIFSLLPAGEKMNYLFQRYITRSRPFSDEKFLEKVDTARRHFGAFQKYHRLDAPGNMYYEFGAGWELIIPLCMSFYGMKSQVIDLFPLAVPSLIQHSLLQFQRHVDALPFKISPTTMQKLSHQNYRDILRNNFSVTYEAPCDARQTSFADNTFDYASSSVTLEHIPGKDLVPLLQETYRILRPGGVLSVTIDYRDHWAYFDQKLSPYHFLQFSERQWRRYNPSLHYQNRLRHSDYVSALKQVGFELVYQDYQLPTTQQRQGLDLVSLDERYRSYNMDDLMILESHMVLRKERVDV